MSGSAMPRSRRVSLWLAVASGLALFIGANWHLIHVATTSQSGCVPHVELGSADGRTSFSAAQSSCTP